MNWRTSNWATISSSSMRNGKKRETWRIVGSGVEPGMADVFARYAAKHLFDTIDEVNVRDGDNYVIPGYEGVAFGFSVWTTIEECLNPPVIWEKGKGWFCTENFSEPEIFNFPGGIGDVEVINVEHEEVMLVPRVIDCNRVTFKYGVPRDMRALLKDLEACGMDSATKNDPGRRQRNHSERFSCEGCSEPW